MHIIEQVLCQIKLKCLLRYEHNVSSVLTPSVADTRNQLLMPRNKNTQRISAYITRHLNITTNIKTKNQHPLLTIHVHLHLNGAVTNLIIFEMFKKRSAKYILERMHPLG